MPASEPIRNTHMPTCGTDASRRVCGLPACAPLSAPPLRPGPPPFYPRPLLLILLECTSHHVPCALLVRVARPLRALADRVQIRARSSGTIASSL